MPISEHAGEKHIAIVGAGNMGSGIAQKYATHGYQVSVIDKFEPSLHAGKSCIEQTLGQGIKKGILDENTSKEILSRLTFSTKLDICQGANLIIEAISEDLQAKISLFKALEYHCDKNTILATNTSSFLVKNLQAQLQYPSRLLGLHYFFHPAKNKLVELIGSNLTDPIYLKEAETLQISINKTIIKSADSPGFIVNRFFVPWLNESMKIVHEDKYNIATVEHAAKTFFNIGLGPFALMNLTGLPITLHACTSLAKSLGEFYAPCPLIMPFITSNSTFNLDGKIDNNATEHIANRLLDVVYSICLKMVFEEKICEAADIDMGAKVGLLWAKGPFELATKHTHATCLKELSSCK